MLFTAEWGVGLTGLREGDRGGDSDIEEAPSVNPGSLGEERVEAGRAVVSRR